MMAPYKQMSYMLLRHYRNQHTSSYLREVLVNDGESQFVDLLIAVLLQCLYLFFNTTHL